MGHDFTLGVDWPAAQRMSRRWPTRRPAGVVEPPVPHRAAELGAAVGKVRPGPAAAGDRADPKRWVPLAAWFRARGVTVILVPPEQSADLRRYYQKHTKNDRLDSVLLARLPLLHPDG